jgi:hypothetical protein
MDILNSCLNVMFNSFLPVCGRATAEKGPGLMKGYNRTYRFAMRAITATQGLFSIEGRDNCTNEIRKVRVVTTISFQLEAP